MRKLVAGCAVLAMSLGLGLAEAETAPAQAAAARPETVMITYRAKPGAEKDLAQAIADHWSTGRALGLILDQPHVTIRDTDREGGIYFVDIFRWRDADAPDNAPAAIRAIWQRMGRLVETRGGQDGLEIAVVSLVAPRD